MDKYLVYLMDLCYIQSIKDSSVGTAEKDEF